jgi:hypothetical protein
MTYAAPSKSGMTNMDNIIKPCVKINCMQPIISHFYQSQEIAQSEHFKTMTHYLTTILIAKCSKGSTTTEKTTLAQLSPQQVHIIADSQMRRACDSCTVC